MNAFLRFEPTTAVAGVSVWRSAGVDRVACMGKRMCQLSPAHGGIPVLVSRYSSCYFYSLSRAQFWKLT